MCAGNSLLSVPEDDPAIPAYSALVPYTAAMDASKTDMSWAMWYKASGTSKQLNALMTRDSVADLYASQTRCFRLALGTGDNLGQLEFQINVGRNRIVNTTVQVGTWQMRHVIGCHVIGCHLSQETVFSH